MLNKEQIKSAAEQTISKEYNAIGALLKRLDDDFVKACEYLYTCPGRIVVTGMGKSGHIANKLAATLASTGSPAFFLHPADASHGDLGMVTPNDVLLAVSKSGNNPEILALMPAIRRLEVPLISLTGNKKSPLAKAANINLDVSVEEEACPFGLAPTASTTTALVMGDALAMALLNARNFTKEDFARSHPGGNLGKRLLLKVRDIMHVGNKVPRVKESVLLKDALLEMSDKRLGFTTILDDKNDQVIGIFTDGDIRRALESGADMNKTVIGAIVRKGCKNISQDALAIDALTLMEKNKITSLLILDDKQHIVGAIHMHDILTAGLNL